MAKDFLTPIEVLKELQIEEDELMQLVSDGDLLAIGDGDDLRFHREEVMKLKEEREANPTASLKTPDPGAPSEGESD